jgi:acid stress-induced BolA-like protein IbaG/YrbA
MVSTFRINQRPPGQSRPAKNSHLIRCPPGVCLRPHLQSVQLDPIYLSVMTRAEDIQRLIEAGLPGAQVRVAGDDGQHFEALIVSADFAGKSLVQQHQLVYRALGQNMRDAVIHALALRTLTPEQYAAEAGR